MKVTTEPTKIELIKQSAIKLMSEHGITATSVSQIAKDAKVSDGYLYRHYKSKEELVESMMYDILSMVNTQIENLMEDSETIDVLVYKFNDYVYQKAIDEPHVIKFIIMLQNDFSYIIHKNLCDEVNKLCTKIAYSKKYDTISKELTIEDIYIAVIALPFQYYSIIHREIFEVDYFKNKELTVRKLTDKSLLLLKY